MPLLPVELGGCASLRADGSCEVSKELRIWLKRRPAGEVRITVDGRAARTSTSFVQGGSLFRVGLSTSTPGLEVSIAARSSSAARAAVHTVRLAPPVRFPALERAERDRQEGNFAQARNELRELLDSPVPMARARAFAKLARIDYWDQNAGASLGEHFTAAIALDRESGLLSEAIRDEATYAYGLITHDRRFAEAQLLLDQADAPRDDDADSRVILDYYQASLAQETGDLRRAMDFFRSAIERAERVDFSVLRLSAVQMLSACLQAVGRGAEAAQLLHEVGEQISAASDPCTRASLLVNLGWIGLLGEESGAPAVAPGAIEDALQEGAAIYSSTCARPVKRANALTNLAIVRADRGDAGGARRALSDARAALSRPDAVLAAWWAIAEGRIALRDGPPHAALAAFDRAASLAAAGPVPGVRWRSALGRAEALERMQRQAAARDAYAEADAALEEDSLLIPLGAGRETFLGAFGRGSNLRVDFLLRRGLVPEAADAARRSISRMLLPLRWIERIGVLRADERRRWNEALAAYRRARDELERTAASDPGAPDKDRTDAAAFASRREQARVLLERALSALGSAPGERAGALVPPRAGELDLIYHPVRDGWVGFALTKRGATAQRLGAIDVGAGDAELSRKLLLPFGALIEQASSIKFIAPRELERRELHALPWKGRPLITRAAVSFGMDTGGQAPAEDRALRPGCTALVVADPVGDLPGAVREAKHVEAHLERAGWRVVALMGPAATRSAVQARLEDATVCLLHYAGHARFAGRDGWTSGLVLAGKTSLELGDILALRRVPPWIVLSACDAATTDQIIGVSGLGLAQAFLTSGSREVVAATRPVGDAAASELMRRFYESQLAPAAEALQRAQIDLYQNDTEWAAFRVLVP